MENNNPLIPTPDTSDIPEAPSVDDISIAEMPEIETASEAVEAAAEPVIEAAEPVAEAAEPAIETAEPAAEPAQVPVVEEYPQSTGVPEYTSYVPQSSDDATVPAAEASAVPAASAPVPAAVTPSYGAAQPQPVQPVRAVPVYVPNQTGEQPGHGKAVASLVLGIFSLLFSWCCCGGLIPGIIGVCLGSSARSSGNKEGIAKAGIGLNIAAIVLSILLGLGFMACSAALGEEAASSDDYGQFQQYFEDYMDSYGDNIYGSVEGLFY